MCDDCGSSLDGALATEHSSASSAAPPAAKPVEAAAAASSRRRKRSAVDDDFESHGAGGKAQKRLTPSEEAQLRLLAAVPALNAPRQDARGRRRSVCVSSAELIDHGLSSLVAGACLPVGGAGVTSGEASEGEEGEEDEEIEEVASEHNDSGAATASVGAVGDDDEQH